MKWLAIAAVFLYSNYGQCSVPCTAICLTGTYRSFATPELRLNFVDSFRAASNGSFHLFAFIQLDVDPRHPHEKPPTTSYNQIASDFNELDKKVISHYNLTVVHNDSKIGCDHQYRAYLQFSKISECYYSMVLPSEKENKIQYDYVIRARTDVFYITPIPLLSSLPHNKIHISKFHGYRTSDHFWISPRSISDKAFDMEKFLCNDPKKIYRNMEAEKVLESFWNARGILVDRGGPAWALYNVVHREKLECHRLTSFPKEHAMCLRAFL